MSVLQQIPPSVWVSALGGLRNYQPHANMMWVHMHMLQNVPLVRAAAAAAAMRLERIQRIRDRIRAVKFVRDAKK
jgi:hypothetical protein